MKKSTLFIMNLIHAFSDEKNILLLRILSAQNQLLLLNGGSIIGSEIMPTKLFNEFWFGMHDSNTKSVLIGVYTECDILSTFSNFLLIFSIDFKYAQFLRDVKYER